VVRAIDNVNAANGRAVVWLALVMVLMPVCVLIAVAAWPYVLRLVSRTRGLGGPPGCRHCTCG